jgi:chromosomal replication initiation ATPase DnaA
MNSKESLEFINNMFVQKNKQVLNDLETSLFLGMWQHQSYKDIACQVDYSEQHLREAGASLCKKITEEIGIKVSKRNFNNPIEHQYQQLYVEVSSSQKSIAKQTNLAQRYESEPTSLPQQNYNPFIPLQGRVYRQQFFAREREIQRIFEAFNSGSSVALIGKKGLGKSSLLWAICQQLKTFFTSPCQAVFLDLNLIHDEDDFYSALCNEIGIPKSKGYILARNLRNCRIILATDNVGNITSKGFSRHVFEQLRGLAEGSDPFFRLILAARVPLNELFNESHNQGNTSPLEGICQEENIEPWDENTVRAFIASRLSMTSVSFTREEIKQLVQESGGHPQRLMQLCHQTYAQYV